MIDIRKRFYQEDLKHKMICSSVVDFKWLTQISSGDSIMVVAEGLTMYLSEEEIKELFFQINNKLGDVHLLFDAYSKKWIRFSRIKNSINQVNAEVKYGFDSPEEFLQLNNNLEFLSTHLIRKDDINLHGLTKFIFNNLYCGKIS